jgi:hypothetical protein
VSRADILQKEADYLAQILSQTHTPTVWNDEIVTISGVQLNNRLGSFDEQMSDILGYTVMAGEAGIDLHTQFISAVSDTDSTSGSAVYLGAGIERRLQVIEPTYEPILVNFELERLTSHDTLFQNLKSVIQPHGEKYIDMLNGSEAALELTNPDSLSQAAHSMRDCFQQLLEQLALSKVVKSQPWFAPTEGAPGQISRRSRLCYILYGSGENIGDKALQHFDELVDIAKNSLDLCIARAHGHDPSLTKEEVLLAIDQARNALLQVLRVYQRHRAR